MHFVIATGNRERTLIINKEKKAIILGKKVHKIKGYICTVQFIFTAMYLSFCSIDIDRKGVASVGVDGPLYQVNLMGKYNKKCT